MVSKTAFCFDLDGTVTQEEILPLLSQEIGLFEEMQVLTEATIKGVIPFDRSFKLRCRLLSEIPISRVQNIIARVLLHLKIVEFITHHRKNCFILTGNLDVWIKLLTERIGCKIFCSQADYEGDKLKGIAHILDKGSAVKQLRADATFDNVIAIGDGMGDAAMFEAANYSIAFGGVHPPIQTLIELSDIIVFDESALCRTLNTLL